MKKNLLYFVPAVIYTVGTIALNIILREPSPKWYLCILLLWISGILLSKGKTWGSIPGLILSVYIILLGMNYTGQVINIEMPLGILTAIYLIGCSILVWKKDNRKANSK